MRTWLTLVGVVAALAAAAFASEVAIASPSPTLTSTPAVLMTSSHAPLTAHEDSSRSMAAISRSTGWLQCLGAVGTAAIYFAPWGAAVKAAGGALKTAKLLVWARDMSKLPYALRSVLGLPQLADVRVRCLT